MINVRTDYGAAGDGITDDSTAINNAITAAYNSSGKAVYAPAGTYIVGSPILVPSGITLVGDGPGATIFKLKNAANCSVIQNSDQIGGNSGLYLRDFTIDGNSGNQTANFAQFGINFFYVQNVRLSNIEAKSVQGTGIYLDGNGQVIGPCFVDGIWAHDNVKYGFFISHSIRRSCIVNVLAEGNGGAGVFIDASELTASNIYARTNGANVANFPTANAGIFIRNVVSCAISNLAADTNYTHGIRVEGFLASVGSAWRACQNGQLTNNTYDDISFGANSVSVSPYGETSHCSVSGVLVGHNTQLNEGFVVGKARYGIYFDDLVNTQVYVTGVQYGTNVTGNVRMPAVPNTLTIVSNA